jgi:hypothetical protein
VTEVDGGAVEYKVPARDGLLPGLFKKMQALLYSPISSRMSPWIDVMHALLAVSLGHRSAHGTRLDPHLRDVL